MAIRSRRMVAARAFAKGGLARAPAARTRLWAMAAMASQAAFSANIWQVRERPVAPVREDLLHDGMVAVLALGLDELERRVGEDCVVPPDGEQFVLPVCGLLVEVTDPADDQPGGDRLAFLRRKGRVRDFGDLGVGDPARSWSSEVARGYLIAVQASWLTAAIADRMLAFIGAVTENRAPWRRTAPITAAL